MFEWPNMNYIAPQPTGLRTEFANGGNMMSAWKKTFAGLATGSLAMGLAMAGPSAQAHDEEAKILKPCDEANVDLRDLAIGGEGKGVKSYYNGNVLMVQIDQVEPAAASSGLVILAHTPDSEWGERTCLAATNFSFLDLDKAQSFYDRGNGLNVSIPAMDYDPEQGISVPGKPLSIKINLGKGEFDAAR